MNSYYACKTYLYEQRDKCPVDTGVINCIDMIVKETPKLAPQYLHYILRADDKTATMKWTHYMAKTIKYDRRGKAILSAYMDLIRGKIHPTHVTFIAVILITTIRSGLYSDIKNVILKSITKHKNRCPRYIQVIVGFMVDKIEVDKSQKIESAALHQELLELPIPDA